jgi:hypothetical protein
VCQAAAEKSDAAYTNNNTTRCWLLLCWVMGDAISWPIFSIYQLLWGVVCAQGQGVATFFLFNTTPYTYSYFNRDFAAENLIRGGVMRGEVLAGQGLKVCIFIYAAPSARKLLAESKARVTQSA